MFLGKVRFLVFSHQHTRGGSNTTEVDTFGVTCRVNGKLSGICLKINDHHHIVTVLEIISNINTLGPLKSQVSSYVLKCFRESQNCFPYKTPYGILFPYKTPYEILFWYKKTVTSKKKVIPPHNLQKIGPLKIRKIKKKNYHYNFVIP